MNIYTFQRINALRLPLVPLWRPAAAAAAGREWDSLPDRFFLYSRHHVVYAAKLLVPAPRGRGVPPRRETVVLFDSMGRQGDSGDFVDFFARRGIEVRLGLGGRALQRHYRSDTCAIHAVLFSLGWRARASSREADLKKTLLPLLERMTLLGRSRELEERAPHVLLQRL